MIGKWLTQWLCNPLLQSSAGERRDFNAGVQASLHSIDVIKVVDVGVYEVKAVHESSRQCVQGCLRCKPANM